MPRGIPKNGKRSPRGTALKSGPASSQTQRLIEALQEIEERLAIEKRKDKARAMVLASARKYGLTASDLREVAKLLGARETGDAPVVSHHVGKVKRAVSKLKRASARRATNGAHP
jgi:hypothetical protein